MLWSLFTFFLLSSLWLRSSARGGTSLNTREKEKSSRSAMGQEQDWVLGVEWGRAHCTQHPQQHPMWKSLRKMSGWRSAGDGVWPWKTLKRGREKCKSCGHGQERPVPGAVGWWPTVHAMRGGSLLAALLQSSCPPVLGQTAEVVWKTGSRFFGDDVLPFNWI